MERCAKCGKILYESFHTAYDEHICENCWDDYICTKEGRVEYLIGICRNDYPACEFDDEFLAELASSWEANKNLVTTISPIEFFRIELRAQAFARFRL